MPHDPLRRWLTHDCAKTKHSSRGRIVSRYPLRQGFHGRCQSELLCSPGELAIIKFKNHGLVHHQWLTRLDETSRDSLQLTVRSKCAVRLRFERGFSDFPSTE